MPKPKSKGRLIDEVSEALNNAKAVIQSNVPDPQFVGRVSQLIDSIRDDCERYIQAPLTAQVIVISDEGNMMYTAENFRAHLEILKVENPELYERYTQGLRDTYTHMEKCMAHQASRRV